MTIKDVMIYVKNTRVATYQYKVVWGVPRKKRLVPCGKDFKINRKRLDKTEEIPTGCRQISQKS